jgi:hypothetical protein
LDCATEYRNGKKTKKNKQKKITIARRKRINQDSDGNEERMEDAHGI